MNTEPQNPGQNPGQHPQGGHDTPLSPPPPAQPTAPVPPPSTPIAQAQTTGAGSGAKAIAIVTAIVGGVALLGSGATAAFAAASELSVHGGTQAVAVDGIDALDLHVGASDVTVEFGDVDEAVLETTGSRGGEWTLRRDDDELIVHSPDRRFGWWFGGWFGDDERVVLTLPENLRTAGLDADISLQAGSVDVDGEFGELDVEVGAGALFLAGSATTLDADVSAGRAEIELDGVSEADLTVSAGRMVAQLTGSAPDDVQIDVSAGSLELTLPDVAYNVTQEVSAGSLDNGLETSSRSAHVIEARVSAGSAALRADD